MNNTNTAAKVGARTQWTKPFHGVQHLGYSGPSSYWATVEDHGTFVMLRRWFPGCGFEPQRSDHETLAEAKARGQRWVRAGILNRI